MSRKTISSGLNLSLTRAAGAASARRTPRTDAPEHSLQTLESRTVMSGTGFSDALIIPINHASGEGTAVDRVSFSGQRFFRFTADQDGLTALSITPKRPLDATIEVFDRYGRLIARPAVAAGQAQPEGLVFNAFEGSQYFVRVIGEHASRGRFSLTIDGAREIDIASGDGFVTDRLDFRGDEDGFNFTPDRAGRVTIGVDPTGSLDAQIRIYDASGRLVAGVIDRAGRGGDEYATINVSGGQTYRAVITGRNGQAGSYAVTFDGSFGYGSGGGGQWSTPIGSVAQSRIDFAGDEDLFSFTAARSGVARVRVDSSYGLDAILRVYAESGSLIASRDSTGIAGSEIIDLSVSAGRRYFVVVDGYRATTGNYTLTLQAPTAPPPPVDDHANAGQFAYATRIPILNSSGNGLGGGSIESYGDTDLFKFTAAGNGQTWIRINPLGNLDAIARVYDSRGFLIDTIDATGSGRAEWINLDVIAGETFFIEVDGYGSSTGSYNVEIDGPSWW